MKLKDWFKVRGSWCKGTGYRNKNHRPCNRTNATSVCLVMAVCDFYPERKQAEIFRKIIKYIGTDCIITWNDKQPNKKRILKLCEELNI